MRARPSSFVAAAVALPAIIGGAAGCTALYWPSDDFAAEVAGSIDAGDGTPVLPEAGPGARDGEAADADAAVDGATPLCPPGALLCDDFERAAGIGPFDTTRGDVALSTEHAHSPTRSFTARAAAGTNASQVEVRLALPSKITMSMWLYIPAPPPGGSVSFRLAHLLWGDTCDWDLAWDIRVRGVDGLVMTATAYDAKLKPSCGPVAGADDVILLPPATAFVAKWHHLVVSHDVAKQQRRVTAVIDDGPAVTQVLTSSRPTVPTAATFTVGIPCIQTDSGCFTWSGDAYSMWVDDVVIAR